MAWTLPGQGQNLGASSRFPTQVAGVQVLNHFPLLSSGYLHGAWIQWGAAETQIYTCRGYWHCRLLLCLFFHITGLSRSFKASCDTEKKNWPKHYYLLLCSIRWLKWGVYKITHQWTDQLRIRPWIIYVLDKWREILKSMDAGNKSCSHQVTHAKH